MSDQKQERAQIAEQALRRRVRIAVFAGGVVLVLAFFAFFPGMPHVVDWGAILIALGFGALAQWGCKVWLAGRRGS